MSIISSISYKDRERIQKLDHQIEVLSRSGSEETEFARMEHKLKVISAKVKREKFLALAAVARIQLIQSMVAELEVSLARNELQHDLENKLRRISRITHKRKNQEPCHDPKKTKLSTLNDLGSDKKSDTTKHTRSEVKETKSDKSENQSAQPKTQTKDKTSKKDTLKTVDKERNKSVLNNTHNNNKGQDKNQGANKNNEKKRKEKTDGKNKDTDHSKSNKAGSSQKKANSKEENSVVTKKSNIKNVQNEVSSKKRITYQDDFTSEICRPSELEEELTNELFQELMKNKIKTEKSNGSVATLLLPNFYYDRKNGEQPEVPMYSK